MKELKIVLLQDPSAKMSALSGALEAQGHQVLERDLVRLSPMLVCPCRPDLLVLNVITPSDRLVHRLVEVQREFACPVVVFAKYCEAVLVSALVKAGASAFVVDGLRVERLPAIIEVAQARFNEMRSLQSQLERANANLVERKDIERAKGILMRRRNLEEAHAYQELRKMAMDRGKRLSEVAHTIIAAEELLAQR